MALSRRGFLGTLIGGAVAAVAAPKLILPAPHVITLPAEDVARKVFLPPAQGWPVNKLPTFNIPGGAVVTGMSAGGVYYGFYDTYYTVSGFPSFDLNSPPHPGDSIILKGANGEEQKVFVDTCHFSTSVDRGVDLVVRLIDFNGNGMIPLDRYSVPGMRITNWEIDSRAKDILQEALAISRDEWHIDNGRFVMGNTAGYERTVKVSGRTS